MKRILYLVTVILLLNACKTISMKDSMKIEEGNYVVKSPEKDKPINITIRKDELLINFINKDSTVVIENNSDWQYDITDRSTPVESNLILRKTELDVDFVTVPFKFRFQNGIVPNQLNTNIGIASFLGARTDRFKLKFYKEKNNQLDKISYFAFSLGVIGGFGGTFISPTTTSDNVDLEYDGVVWMHGVSAIMAVDDFNIGFVVGWDYLLDSNKEFWIYQNRPWLGLSFGINLN